MSHQFQWECQPKAENLVLNVLNEALNANPLIKELQLELEKHTSTRLFDWLDHVSLLYSESLELQLEEAGFVLEQTAYSYRVFHHPGAQLPKVVVKDRDVTSPKIEIAVSVEKIVDFLMVRGLSSKIEGSILAGYRKCTIGIENDVELIVVERHGSLSMEPLILTPECQSKILQAIEMWQTRSRSLQDEDQSMQQALKIAEEIIELVGVDRAASIVLSVERAFWQSKNLAGQLQKNRQDRLGMGWANHDHHTFRSSRKRFSELVRLFEMLGFHCRERYYAGKEAGWGAQIMENPKAKLVLFLDVDLNRDELDIDFAHHPLPKIDHLGTVGLWTALHGDSILKGGMHHLEAQFLFDELTADLHHLGVGMMAPFSAFPYLKQAFTAGEIWQVDPQKVNKLYEEGLISKENKEKFIAYGAIGSHLENLQRREGYKGFNQKNVSVIIKQTDPRLHLQ